MLLFCFTGSAATYYVDTTNSAASDANAGSSGSPWKTITKAATNAAAGDTVIIQPGLYNEFVTNTISGTAGNPVTFTGVRAPDGSWLTIIDPSTALSSWSAAPEINSNVWKATVAFTPSEVTINTQRVAAIFAMGSTPNATNAYRNALSLSLTNGTNWLCLATNVDMTSGETGNAIKSWDGLEALWGSTGGQLYLRKRDGSAPTAISASSSAPAVSLMGKSYLVWSNVAVQKAYVGFLLSDSSNNAIVSNAVMNGYCRVLCQSNSVNNLIVGNSLTANYYGYADPGAWILASGSPDNSHVIREIIYDIAKYLISNQSASWDFGIIFQAGPCSNTVSGNTIFKGMGEGISLNGANGWMTNNVFRGNSISQCPSVGFLFSENHYATQVYSNIISDCDINMRFHHFGSDDGMRLVFIYRNISWQSDNYGDHIFLHCRSSSASPNFAWPTYWVYHNSYSGGAIGVGDNGYLSNGGQLTNSVFVNNIFSGCVYFSSSTAAWVNATNVGAWDYNIWTTPYPTYPSTNTPAWYGTHDIRLASPVWVNAPGMSFALPAGSSATDAAVDVSQAFAAGVSNFTYAALPVDGTVKKGTAWDIGALEYVPPQATANTLHAGTLRSPP